MKIHIIQIGSYRGIRLPKAWLQTCNLEDANEAEVEIKKKGLVILRPQSTRAHWEESFKKMAAMNDDELLIPDNLENDWDQDEWK